MASSKKSTSVPSSSKLPDKTVVKKTSTDIAESYIVVWLDPNLDFTNEENQTLISQLRSIVNVVQTFNTIDLCIEFISQSKNTQVFLIVSDCFLKQVALVEERFVQVNSIYVFCDEKSKHDEIIRTYKKGKGVFTQMKSLCNVLAQEVRQLNNDLVSTSFISASSTTNSNELEPSFMYFQLLKEHLLENDYDDQVDVQRLADYCRPMYEGDVPEQEIIADFEENYSRKKTPIWWYTRESFLYNELNRSLRTLDIEMLLKMGFFIRNLHEQLKKLHSEFVPAEIPLIVHRGQGMMNKEFEKLKASVDGLYFFNSFVSTSTNKGEAEEFARRQENKKERTPVLFEIEVDPSIKSVPFAPISHLSAIPSEAEILFSMSAVFRIKKIEPIDKRLWRVDLTLTNDRDRQLQRLTEHMRTSLGSGSTTRRFAQLMLKMGHFDKAIETYRILLKTVDPTDPAEPAFLHNQLGYLHKQKDELEDASLHYQESLRLSRAHMSETDPRLSSTYSNIGGVLKKSGKCDAALRYYELVLKIDLAASNSNPIEIAIDYNNIGSVLDDQGKYQEALKNHEQSLNIKLSHLPPHHPSLANTYSNIGLIHRKMGDCTTALSFYQKTLETQKKSLPNNHPSFIVTYGKLATVFEDLRQYKQAIDYAQQAASLAEQILGSSHPETTKRQAYLEELKRKI